ncbi:hypothetical protein [Fodinibius salsisoli]|uniref:Uncharacterized protein n=1 Tax=Fodinibius salsisoli TaxID=2820877 RepID=A0ABT3PH61_9BACT|nr:hypothetical protein [Fodinibius salsisoli]MCW9705266.1 hypothetical protein [Fodinibius salsisoli]
MNSFQNFQYLFLSSSLVFLSFNTVIANPSVMQTDSSAWREAPFEILSAGYPPFQVDDLGHPYAGREHCVVRVAPEIKGLKGIRIPAQSIEGQQPVAITIEFDQPAKVLLALFQAEDEGKYLEPSDFDGPLSAQPILENGLTFTGLPPVDIYALPLEAGKHTIQPQRNGLFSVVGVIEAEQPITPRNAGRMDGCEWDTFIVEGFSEKAALFDIVGGKDQPVVDKGMPGTEGNRGGFEGGRLVKIDDTYHMFPTERIGEEGIGSYQDRVKTRIAHWTSKDAVHWTRQSTLYESSGDYAVTDTDNPANDRRSALWSFMPTFSEKENRWLATYVGYTTHRTIEPNHSFGRIWQAQSVQKGKEGIGGPYEDRGIIMEPGLNSQLWEGRQAVQSFFPFKVEGGWHAFYGGGFPWGQWSNYPDSTQQGWYVGLAKADSLEGPWARMDTTVNPITSMHPWFIENPIVSQLPNGVYIAIYDGGPDGWGLHLPNMFGYSLSLDGLHWTESHYFPIRTKVDQWWDIMRTPMGLIPEGHGIYTVVYAAIDNDKRFHPLGMVKFQLNREVLRHRTEQMRQNLESGNLEH